MNWLKSFLVRISITLVPLVVVLMMVWLVTAHPILWVLVGKNSAGEISGRLGRSFQKWFDLICEEL